MSAAAPLFECHELSKVFCRGFEQGRRYAFLDILRPGRRSIERLRHDEFLVVDRFSVTVRKGENVLVLGLPGAGKTTIAKLLTGMLLADAGEVRFQGRLGLVSGGKLGMVPFLTVWEYIQLATGIHGAEPDVHDACCEAALELTGLSDQRDVKLVDLEKGQTRYLSIAASLVVPHDIRIFDGLPRPSVDLTSRRIAAQASELLESGSNLILAGSTANLPAGISHAVILHEGETLFEGGLETVVPVFDHFVYRMQRIEQLTREAEESGQPVDPARILSPPEIIARARRSLERSRIGPVVEERIAQAWRSTQPIVVGPYLSDVGFELLYWRPFVAWMHQHFGARTAPVIAVSRGRVGAWYSGTTTDYVDVCDLVDFDTFLTRNRQRVRATGSWKQKVVADFDRELLDLVSERYDGAELEVLHPSLIFRVCSRIWNATMPHGWLAEHGAYDPFEVAPPPDDAAVPDEPYVAASFWFSNCYTDTRPHRHLIHLALSELSQRMPVVVVDTGGFPGVPESLEAAGRIRVIPGPEQSEGQLGLQSRVIAGARAYMGTFGNISQLAPFYRVPSLLFFDEDGGLSAHHRRTSQAIAESMDDSTVDVVRAPELNPARLSAWIDQALS